jgi:hypothetical protein
MPSSLSVASRPAGLCWRLRFAPRRHGAIAIVLAAGLASSALAGDGPRAARVPLLPVYAQECGACHLAYPPGLLPAASWQRQVQNLSRHYGSDASLDAATTQQLFAWLTANAGQGKRAATAPPDDRITRSPWFVREHDEVSAALWKRPAINSAANCQACHVRADQGDFNEHDIRIPR